MAAVTATTANDATMRQIEFPFSSAAFLLLRTTGISDSLSSVTGLAVASTTGSDEVDFTSVASLSALPSLINCSAAATKASSDFSSDLGAAWTFRQNNALKITVVNFISIFLRSIFEFTYST